MKVLIMTLGTRWEVQPFVALARGLAAAGHDAVLAVLAAPRRFDEFVRNHGVNFAGIDDGPMRLMDGGPPWSRTWRPAGWRMSSATLALSSATLTCS